jgi:hypothetical protein
VVKLRTRPWTPKTRRKKAAESTAMDRSQYRIGVGGRPLLCRWPGLILECRPNSTGCSGLVVYAISVETVTTIVQTWVSADH